MWVSLSPVTPVTDAHGDSPVAGCGEEQGSLEGLEWWTITGWLVCVCVSQSAPMSHFCPPVVWSGQGNGHWFGKWDITVMDNKKLDWLTQILCNFCLCIFKFEFFPLSYYITMKYPSFKRYTSLFNLFVWSQQDSNICFLKGLTCLGKIFSHKRGSDWQTHYHWLVRWEEQYNHHSNKEWWVAWLKLFHGLLVN